jgi:hypothetical protein
MAGRSISRFALAALAASALLGACVKHVDEQAAAAPPPPPPEQPALMGAATTTPADTTTADAAAAQTQANDDAYVSSLPAGLMAVHKFDAATGRTILVISNYPVANPGLRARIWHARHHSILKGGTDKASPSITTASAAPVTTATPTATPAPTTMAAAASTPSATHSTPVTQTAGFKGLTLSPGMWLIGGLALLAVIVLVMLAGRKQQRREPLRA